MANDPFQEKKDSAFRLLEKQEFREAFDLLWEMGVEAFAMTLLNPKGKKKRDFLPAEHAGTIFFWEHFLPEPAHLATTFQSEFATDFLDKYFSYDKPPRTRLLHALAEAGYEIALIQAVRTNRAFLKPEWCDHLQALKYHPKFQLHCSIWERLRNAELTLWGKVNAAKPGVAAYTLFEVLAETVIWLEFERFPQTRPQHHQFLARVYSCFVENILPVMPAFKNRPHPFTEEYFFRLFGEILKKVASAAENPTPVFMLLNALREWLNFYEHTIELYCYDTALDAVHENELLQFRTNPSYYYAEQTDGIRYQAMQFYYVSLAANFVYEKEKNGKLKIPDGKKDGDKHHNRQVATLKYSTLLALDDLCISDFSIDNNPIDTEQLLGSLVAFSYNRKNRYEDALEKHAQKATNWTEAYIRLAAESASTGLWNTPYLFMSVEEYERLNLAAIDLPPEISSAVVKLFSYQPGLKTQSRFDRYHDVFLTPFLITDNNLFVPMMFWGNNIWFYTFIQRALLIRGKEVKYNSEITVMENYLGELFREKGWNVKVVTQQESESMGGDIDIIVDDVETVLLLQLKRTYLRINIKDGFTENNMIDRKAARQLNKAEASLLAGSPVYKLDHKPVKWIVSTSFEGIHSVFDTCCKINYFEVVQVLKHQPFKTLQEFVAFIEHDTHLRLLHQAATAEDTEPDELELIQDIGLPIPLFEPKDYKQPFHTADENKTAAYITLYNNGLSAYHSGDHTKAIALLDECTSQNNTDAEAWGALANCYADVRRYDEAIACFKRALELHPHDPFTSRNLALMYLEAGKYEAGIELYMDLYEKYPLLDKIKNELLINFYGLIRAQKLAPAAAVSIINRLKTLHLPDLDFT